MDQATLEADVAHIASVTLTSGTVVVSVSTFTADQRRAQQDRRRVRHSDSAANISASLNALNDANINAISISDNGAVVATLAQLSSERRLNGKLANASGTPYQLAIQDTAANVVGGLIDPQRRFYAASITVSERQRDLSEGVGRERADLLGNGLGDEPHHRRGACLRRRLQPGRRFDDGDNGRTFAFADGNGELERDDERRRVRWRWGGAALRSAAARRSTASHLSISGSSTSVTLGETLLTPASFSEAAAIRSR